MFLGLDLGTTNVKALVTDRAGQPLAHAASPVALFHVGAGGVEQDIEEIEQATLAAMRQVGQRGRSGRVSKPSACPARAARCRCSTRRRRPLGRVISWLDQRGRPFDQAFTAELGREWFLQHISRGCSGLASASCCASATTVPELLHAPNRVGFVGDIVVVAAVRAGRARRHVVRLDAALQSRAAQLRSRICCSVCSWTASSCRT